MGSTKMAYQGRPVTAAPPAITSSDTSVTVSNPNPNNRPTGYICQGLRIAAISGPKSRLSPPRLDSSRSNAASSTSPPRIRLAMR
ncbi:Uncharacterised protein [Mycobacteroides abscessus subsp. abscessus]|nr:Uncharacterised protein [Mycobacteroides abscessus subsp. abscessus]